VGENQMAKNAMVVVMELIIVIIVFQLQANNCHIISLIIKVTLAYYFTAFERSLENVKKKMELEALNLRNVSLERLF
jgi:hypothetical protein